MAVALVVVLAAAGMVWASTRGASASQDRPGANQGRSTVASVVSQPPRSAAGSGQSGATGRSHWQATLAALDAVRTTAFATRNARLLSRVYTPGPLLAADTALLGRIVPAGCGQTGVRTEYRGLQATTRGTRVLLTARATLRPSRLICAGHSEATAAGAGPTTLHLEVARTPQGPRIAGQRAG